MNILIIGGTGLVGSYLLPRLVKNGHEIFALTRAASKIDRIKAIGALGILGDILNPQSFLKELPDKPDFIILLAMPGIIPGKRINKKRKAALREETTGFFRNSMDLAIHFNAPIILPSGTSYLTGHGEIADETWPIRRAGLTEAGSDTDDMINQAVRTGKPEIIQLIYGRIYGNGGLFRFQYEMLKKKRYKIIGKGENYIPVIHASDAANAIIKSIEKKPFGEKFIIADDTPVNQRDFTNHMADLMGLKRPGRIPGSIIKFALGRDLYEVISMNCMVSNNKAESILGWDPEYPSYRTGLEQAIKEMEKNQPCFM
jgi:nucleoside-diphosphate-sugar epimerase